ncbi:MAG: 50S ribosomal protein L24 [Candidatus Omnitrophica bacterium]|nr:50S ribosomal protein L24 [Candidatus Omnitrophota bacterium]
MRIRRGDKVKVLAGKDKGKTGKVIHVYPEKGKALVEGVNMIKKHARKSQQHPKGAILSQESLIALAKLSLVDPNNGKATRFRTLVAKDGSKQRVAVGTKAVIA